jgi:hypothetical protein
LGEEGWSSLEFLSRETSSSEGKSPTVFGVGVLAVTGKGKGWVGMAEELAKLYGKISLTETEKIGIQVDEGDVAEAREVVGKCLVGKLWTEKKVNRKAFKNVMTSVWRLEGRIKYKDLRDNIWLFEFTDEAEKRRILEGRPWTYDRQMLVLNEYDGRTPPSQLEFKQSPFWVQVHDMPIVCMNKAVGTKIGSSMGTLEDVDVAGDGMGWGSYLRLTSDFRHHESLWIRGRALKLGQKSTWVEFKYEKLPLFCFRCGCIAHGPKGCPVLALRRYNTIEEAKPWAESR